jgi:hypothetical protein
VRRVELFRVISGDTRSRSTTASHLAIAHADSSRPAIRPAPVCESRTLAEFRVAAEIPALFCHEVDAGGVREAGPRSPSW